MAKTSPHLVIAKYILIPCLAAVAVSQAFAQTGTNASVVERKSVTVYLTEVRSLISTSVSTNPFTPEDVKEDVDTVQEGGSTTTQTQEPVVSGSCTIANTTGVLNVSNPSKVSSNEMEYLDSVNGTQRMLYEPASSIFCQNGVNVAASGVSGNCQLKPQNNKIYQLICN